MYIAIKYKAVYPLIVGRYYDDVYTQLLGWRMDGRKERGEWILKLARAGRLDISGVKVH